MARLDDLGEYRQVIHLANPGAAAPDGAGGYAETWAPLDPELMHAAIDIASVGDQERLGVGTVLSQATHVVRLRFHPQITTKTRITYNGRSFSVTAVRNVEERDRRLMLLCAEIVP